MSPIPSPMPPNEGLNRPLKGEPPCSAPRTAVALTSRPASAAGAPLTGRPPPSAGWSAAHWKTATFGWLALVLLAFAVGGQVGTKQADPTKAGPGESGRMDRILDAGFKVPASESVLIQSRSLERARRPSTPPSRTS